MANGLHIWDAPEAGEKNSIVMVAVSQLKIVNAPEYELPIQIPRK